MKFRFKSASCVVVGTFNIYVVQPRLLVEMGVFEKGTHFRIDQDLSQPGVRLSMDEIKWVIRPDRLLVESQKREADCGTPLGQILSKLVWTPVFAVGTNIVLESDEVDESQFPEKCRLPYVENSLQRTIHLSTKRENRILNVQVAANEEDVRRYEIKLNVHTDFGEMRSIRSQQELNEMAVNTCCSFQRQQQEILEFTQSVFPSLKVYHDDDNQ